MSDWTQKALKTLAGIETYENHSLRPYTTMRVGGPAELFVVAKNEAEVLKVAQIVKEFQKPLFILGGGSNLLVSDEGLRGVVLILKGELAKIEATENGCQIWAGTGASFPQLTKTALRLGWEMALGLYGTPGQVGGALKMNAGTRLGEIGQVVKEVHGMTPAGPIVLQKADIGYAYRTSKYPKDMILTKVLLENLNEHGDPTELQVKAKSLLLARRGSQPKSKTAGCIFKNPPGDFAGRLIEAAGLKGSLSGGAQISDVHANFIINKDSATASDVYTLARKTQEVIETQFHIRLEFEVQLAGKF